MSRDIQKGETEEHGNSNGFSYTYAEETRFSDVIGIDHVAIGSDNCFGDKNAMHAHTIKEHAADGLQDYLSFSAPYMEGIENPSEWLNITRALVKRGYSDEDIQKLIGGNVLRFVEQVVG